MEKVIHTLAELEAEADAFLQILSPRESAATLITLSGELGAGKTAFTKGLAKALGVEGIVTSPTFVLEKIYQLPLLGGETAKFTRLIHIDAYRLTKGTDLAPLGFDEILKDPSNLIVLEWPEMVEDALPPPAVSITLTLQSDGSRMMRMTHHEN